MTISNGQSIRLNKYQNDDEIKERKNATHKTCSKKFGGLLGVKFIGTESRLLIEDAVE